MMYAQIYAVSPESSTSTGKRSYVNVENFELSLKRRPAKHLGRPGKYLEIKARGLWEISSGLRGANERNVEREVTIQFLPHEIKRLLTFAVRKGILTTGPEGGTAAEMSLVAMLQSLGLRLTERSTATRRNRRAR